MKNRKNFPLKLDIQFFAEETSPNPDGTPTDTPPEEQPMKIELTEAELQKKIEAESDRKLAKALEKKEAEWQANQTKAIEEAIAEKERLSQLSEKERKDEELSALEKKLQDRLAEVERKELKADAISDLTEKGLSPKFADFLLSDSAESTLANINAFKEEFDLAVKEAVKLQLRGTPPKKPTGTGKVYTKQEIMDVKDDFERKRLIAENAHLFNIK